MRHIEGGNVHLAKFCAIMDLPPAVQISTYEKIKDEMLAATKAVAEASMNATAVCESNL